MIASHQHYPVLFNSMLNYLIQSIFKGKGLYKGLECQDVGITEGHFRGCLLEFFRERDKDFRHEHILILQM